MLAAASLILGSCKACDEPDPVLARGADARPLVVPLDARGVEAAPPVAGEAGTPDASLARDEGDADAGASGCKLSYGPIAQPFRGPGALAPSGGELRVVVNDSGKPRIYPVPIPGKGAALVVPPRPSSTTGTRWPPCELAGRFSYCQAPGGAVVRTTLGSADGMIVGRSRPGTRITAASVGVDHSVVAFLDVRRTTEGDMLQAFVALDDGEPDRVSEDGAGATTLHFLSRGESPVLVYLDTRTAMVPVHARPVSRGPDGKLAFGADAVIFVGGVPERGIDFAVASAGPRSFAFVPMPRETLDFGMATILIEDPPKDDVHATWSMYPNGLDPAPIAASKARDGKGAWVARVRPRQRAVGSPRVLELGRVDAEGAFTSLGEISSGKAVTDIAIEDDASGGVWLLYSDTSVTWLERRVCF